jgi:hypothetical protein
MTSNIVEERENNSSYASCHDMELMQNEKTMEQTFDNGNLLERSLLASRDHVFLTWHDINFIVPLKKTNESNSTVGLMNLDDPRVEMIVSHQRAIQSIKSSANYSVSDKGSINALKFDPQKQK